MVASKEVRGLLKWDDAGAARRGACWCGLRVCTRACTHVYKTTTRSSASNGCAPETTPESCMMRAYVCTRLVRPEAPR